MKLTTKKIARAGIIAAIYTAATLSFGALAFGPLQVRPAEALTLLPLIYFESVFGLFVGCLLSNLFSGYGLLDVVLGSLTTLLAAILTYLSGRLFKKTILKIGVGGLFPIFLNALILPIIWKLAGDNNSFWLLFYPVCLTQMLWVYLLGSPVYKMLITYKNKGLPYLQ